MPVSFECSACHVSIRVSRQHAGRRGKCPRCGTVQAVPVSEGSDLGSQDLEPFEVEHDVETQATSTRSNATSKRAAIQEEWKKAAARERKIAKILITSLLVTIVIFILILKFGVLGFASGVGIGSLVIAAVAVVAFGFYCLWWHIRQQSHADTNWSALGFLAVVLLGAGFLVSSSANKRLSSGSSQSTGSAQTRGPSARCTEDVMLFPTTEARDAAVAGSAIGRSDYAVVAALAAGAPRLSKGTTVEIVGIEILRVRATGELISFYQVRVCSGPSVNSVGWVLFDSVQTH